jgi:hypothetical protein
MTGMYSSRGKVSQSATCQPSLRLLKRKRTYGETLGLETLLTKRLRLCITEVRVLREYFAPKFQVSKKHSTFFASPFEIEVDAVLGIFHAKLTADYLRAFAIASLFGTIYVCL